MVPRRAHLSILARLSPLILIWFQSATAQYHLDSWTTDNGLPQNSIRSIIQTRDGYLWMTTFDGLVRFNGVQFKVFDKSNTRGLSTNRFTSLYEDKEGTLWAGTGDGGLTRYRDGIFTSYTAADGVPAGQVMAFAHDLKGELLIAIGNGQFYMREGKFIPAPPEYGAQNLTHYRAPSGTQWTIGTNGAKQIKDGSVTQYPITLSGPGDASPYEDSKGNLWLGDKSGIYRLRDSKITRYSKKDGVPTRAVLQPSCEDDEGGIWFVGYSPVRFKDGRFTVYGKNELSGL